MKLRVKSPLPLDSNLHALEDFQVDEISSILVFICFSLQSSRVELGVKAARGAYSACPDPIAVSIKLCLDSIDPGERIKRSSQAVIHYVL